MNVKTIKTFQDLEAGVIRKVGDTFSVSTERQNQINSAGFGKLVEETAEAVEEQKEIKPKETAKKSTKK